jgi:hypothetical protein
VIPVGPELDQEVALKIRQWKRDATGNWFNPKGEPVSIDEISKYSTDPEKAENLRRWIESRWGFCSAWEEGGRWVATAGRAPQAFGATREEAICRAALNIKTAYSSHMGIWA